VNLALTTLRDLRIQYHKRLQQTIWRYVGDQSVPSNADGSNKLSVLIARGMLEEVQETISPIAGQTSGKEFTNLTLDFLRDAFLRLEHIRPGPWRFSASQAKVGIAAFQQYEHLAILQQLLDSLEQDASNDSNKDLRAMFASDYIIKPDIVIARDPLSDERINNNVHLLKREDNIATYTPLRAVNNSTPILHASVSCKWTFRSDRAQNARTEALNLIRNRKGNTPHIVVVTGEPLPHRLSSLALGTGDIDCMYHMALFELEAAIKNCEDETQAEMFDTLVRGHRLRDISDLPFDLAI
jgi:NgoMIV restriction enzyme